MSKGTLEVLLCQLVPFKKESMKCVTIMHNKMDHSKTFSPHFSHKSKHMDLFMKLLIFDTKMIVHSKEDD